MVMVTFTLPLFLVLFLVLFFLFLLIYFFQNFYANYQFKKERDYWKHWHDVWKRKVFENEDD